MQRMAVPERFPMAVCLSKDGDTRFLGHLDFARLVERSLRRSGLPIVNSQGFNPRQKVSFTDALPVGVASEGEWITLSLYEDRTPEILRERLEPALPECVRLVDVRRGSAPTATRLRYRLDVSENCRSAADALAALLQREDFVLDDAPRPSDGRPGLPRGRPRGSRIRRGRTARRPGARPAAGAGGRGLDRPGPRVRGSASGLRSLHEAAVRAGATSEREVMGRRRRGGGAQRAIGRKLLINSRESEESRIAVLEAGRLEEYYIERGSLGSTLGNIYKARVTNVEASIGAAFVEFGHSRQGFLHVSDLCMAAVGKNQRALLASVQQAREDAHDEDVIDMVSQAPPAETGAGEPAAAEDRASGRRRDVAPLAERAGGEPARDDGDEDEGETDELVAEAPGYAAAPEVLEPGAPVPDDDDEEDGEALDADAETERKAASVAFAKGEDFEGPGPEEDEDEGDEGELEDGEVDQPVGAVPVGTAEPGADGAARRPRAAPTSAITVAGAAVAGGAGAAEAGCSPRAPRARCRPSRRSSRRGRRSSSR
jgi:hypothetical protein